MIFFTSDTHFWHKHIIGYCRRPFDSIEGMNASLIQFWNQRVHKDDEVWFLGDFAFCSGVKAREIFDQLHGSKHLVRGNHDPSTTVNLPWESVHDYKLLRPSIEVQKDDGELVRVPHPIILFHFPILSWDGMANGSWHLHGHCHGSLPDNGSLHMDVGVDPNRYEPISLQEIQDRMALRTVVPVDHHSSEHRTKPA